MNIIYKLGFLLLSAVTIIACVDNSLDFNNPIRSQSDSISIKADTFHLSNTNYKSDYIYCKRVNSDSMSLGSYNHDLFGRTTCEILAQFNAPGKVDLSQTIDSAYLKLYIPYSNCVAKGDSTFTIRVFRMNTNTFKFEEKYNSNINPLEYSNKQDTLLTYTFTKPVGSTSGSMILTLDTSLCKEFIDSIRSNPQIAEDKDKFLNFFKGIYVSVVGETGSAMISVSKMEMFLVYYYKNDAETTISQKLDFVASTEVRQVNRIVHDYSQSTNIPVVDSVMYISSPAGMNATITVPLTKIKQGFNIQTNNGVAYLGSGKRMIVNRATMTVELADIDSVSRSHNDAPPRYLMLIKKSKVDKFFESVSPSVDRINTVLATYSSTTKSYTFNLNSYLTNELKATTVTDDELVLLPVYYSSTTGLVKQDINLHYLRLRSANHPTHPLKMDVIISGL